VCVVEWQICAVPGRRHDEPQRKEGLKQMDNWTVKTFKTASLESEQDFESCSAFRTQAKSIFCVVEWMVLANVNDISPEAEDH
jgi:hypothetical protein